MFRVKRLCSIKGDTRIASFCSFFHCRYYLIKEKKHAQVTICIENMFLKPTLVRLQAFLGSARISAIESLSGAVRVNVFLSTSFNMY